MWEMASYSNWDLAFLPKFAFSQVDEYLKKESKSSGEKHISKGIKYYKEQFVHAITGEYFGMLLSPQVTHFTPGRL